MGGTGRGDEPLYPEGNSTLRCTLRSPAPALIITFPGLGRIVLVHFFVSKMSLARETSQRNENFDRRSNVFHATPQQLVDF